MSKSTTLRIFGDPGHAWCRFPLQRLEALAIADKISHYSYQNGANAFLEEDCDLAVLVHALKARGYDIKFHETHTRSKSSKIRSFQPYYYGKKTVDI
jgi:N-acetyl-anhydromuramyl-L-alanine amidase AmpD